MQIINGSVKATMAVIGLTSALLPLTVAAQIPALTVEQVMEKYIAASGGAEAYRKINSTVAKGTLEVVPQGLKGTFEVSAKAPDQMVMVQNIAGIGETRQGYDGKLAWSKDPLNGLRTLDGAELASTKRDSVFNAPLHWKTIYKTWQTLGIKKVDGKDAYAILLTPAEGKPVTQYFDAKSFLLIRVETIQESIQGTLPVQVDLSDYHTVDGVKEPFTIREKFGPAQVVMKTTEVKNNVSLTGDMFSKPTDDKK